jgi:FHA domain
VASAKEAWLVDAQGRRFSLAGPAPIRLGRASDNAIVLADPTVSQHHALISYENGSPYLRDLESVNGTFINDVAVQHGELTDGCEVRLGNTRLTYRQSSIIAASRRWIAVAAGIAALLIIVAIGHALVSKSSSPAGRSAPAEQSAGGTGNMFAAGNDYVLPEASSDFIGNWCGWDRVAACQPPGSCRDVEAPEGISFTGGGGEPVTLHTQLMGSANDTVSDIAVHSQGPHTVHITFVETIKQPNGQANQIVNISQNIVSTDPATVNDTETRSLANDPSYTETMHAELHKCTDQFARTSDQWYKQHNLVQRGTLDGKLSP